MVTFPIRDPPYGFLWKPTKQPRVPHCIIEFSVTLHFFIRSISHRPLRAEALNVASHIVYISCYDHISRLNCIFMYLELGRLLLFCEARKVGLLSDLDECDAYFLTSVEVCHPCKHLH